MVWYDSAARKGATRLDPQRYAELVVRIVRNRHAVDVVERAAAILGVERANRMGPVDLVRNVLASWLDRVCRAYSRAPLVSGLGEELAAALGDVSAAPLIERYAAAGGRPMPTTIRQASRMAQRYQEAAGYAGVLLDWSRRTGRISLRVVTPDDLELTYADDDPTEPTVIRHRAMRQVQGRAVEVVEVYDLTDLAAPSYRILRADGGEDVTAEVLGRTYVGEGYLSEWSYADGRPYHRIVVRGHPEHLYDRLQQVEASLTVPMRWTTWGSGTDFASHPGRNVRGLVLAGMASSTTERGIGLADGPEVIKVWTDADPDRPGDHWQDSPAYDPLTLAQAIGLYESLALSMIDLPVDLSSTGGEPTAREAEALEERIVMTYDECRRFDGELLARAAALANRLAEVEGDGIPEGPYSTLYRGEIDEVLTPPDDAGDGGDGGDDG